MTLCIECNGKGSKIQLSFRQNVNGTTIAASTTYPPVNTASFPNVSYACTGCAGTGIYQNFGV